MDGVSSLEAKLETSARSQLLALPSTIFKNHQISKQVHHTYAYLHTLPSRLCSYLPRSTVIYRQPVQEEIGQLLLSKHLGSAIGFHKGLLSIPTLHNAVRNTLCIEGKLLSLSHSSRTHADPAATNCNFSTRHYIISLCSICVHQALIRAQRITFQGDIRARQGVS